MQKIIHPLLLAYIAGFFDGEGSVYISAPVLRRKRRKICYTSNRVTVSAVNTIEEPILLLVKLFGGGVSVVLGKKRLYRDSKKVVRVKDSFRWRCPARNKRFFLEAVLPYVIVKKERIKLALSFLKTKNLGYGGRGRPSLPVKLKQKRQALYLSMKKLNQKGVKTCPF